VLPKSLLGLAACSLRLRRKKPLIGPKLRARRLRKFFLPAGNSRGHDFRDALCCSASAERDVARYSECITPQCG
jgi:hypothetical protein